jgi:hypothetical protein
MLESISGQLGETRLQGGQKILKQTEGLGQGILDTGKNIGEEATGLLKGIIPKKEDESK